MNIFLAMRIFKDWVGVKPMLSGRVTQGINLTHPHRETMKCVSDFLRDVHGKVRHSACLLYRIAEMQQQQKQLRQVHNRLTSNRRQETTVSGK